MLSLRCSHVSQFLIENLKNHIRIFVLIEKTEENDLMIRLN